jgi:serine/threonine protein kinase
MKLDYVLTSQIYENADAQVYVYRGTVQQGTVHVAIKITLHGSLSEANAVINEAMCQARLSHTNICRVMDCFMEETQDRCMRSVLILELMNRDLAAEIEARKKMNGFWSEMELITYLGELVSALLYAQSKGVSHRDIKPQNIFVDQEGHLKLGDFGSSSSIMGTVQLTGVQGTPLFLSPELREWYRAHMGDSDLIPEMDPYQSDVFSLGITFLYMAKLSPPVELLFGQSIETTVEQIIATIQYPTLAGLLRWMLAVNPAQRPTFQALFDYLSPMLPQIPEFAERMRMLNPQMTINAAQTEQNQHSAYELTFMAPSQASTPASQMPKQCNVCGSYFHPNHQWQVRSDGTCVCNEICLNKLQAGQFGTVCAKCSRQIQDLTWVESVRSQFGEYSSNLQAFCSSSCAARHFGIKLQPPQPKHYCAGCGKAIIITDLRESETVQLMCLHLFHDIDCLLSYYKHVTSDFTQEVQFACPICNTPISADITDRVIKMRNSLLKLQNCENCKTTPMTRLCDVGHRLCTSCCAKKYSLPRMGRKAEHCPVCCGEKKKKKAENLYRSFQGFQ